MIIGEHNRENDLEVNALKGKQLTNIRTTSKDEAVRLTPPKHDASSSRWATSPTTNYVEVTPKSIRLRKIASRPERAQARRNPAPPPSRSSARPHPR
jgi:GTP-binding protein